MGRPSTGEYPDYWPQLSEAIKAAAGYKCIRCGHKHDPAAGYTLTVHHLDLNKSNCEWWNLVALCQRCHLFIQARVVMERIWFLEHSLWFRPYVAGYYASLRGLFTFREFVDANLDDLLDIRRLQVHPNLLVC